MSRRQARWGNGRFTQNTLENTVGLHCDICKACGSLNPYGLTESPPDACHRCGEVFVRERCAHGRCTDRFPDPLIWQRGGYKECGAPAAACSVERRWGLCEEHAALLQQGGADEAPPNH